MSISATPKTLRHLRIISIPLTRPPLLRHPSSNGRANRILTYYQFQITIRKGDKSTEDSTSSEVKGSWLSRWRPEGGIAKWVTAKAAETWASFGKANGGWKVRISPFFSFFFFVLTSSLSF
jgi:hypothetical protein